MNRPSNADSYKNRAKENFSMQPAFLAAQEMRMEIVVAIELIVGAVFVIGFWYKNPELMLSRRLTQELMDPYDDE